MVPSKYQVAVYDWIRRINGSNGGALVVEAVAGSGKTSTIVDALSQCSGRVLFLAFNKHIAEELGRRVPEGVTVSTLNAFGWRAVRRAYPGIQLDANKAFTHLKNAGVPSDQIGVGKQLLSLKRAVPSLSMPEIIDRWGVDVPEEPFMTRLKACWTSLIRDTNIADFDDQLFMARNLPLEKFDWVFVDEAQDLSEVQVSMIKKISPRVVAVGDPYQAIYGFRGAMPDAMDQIRHQLQAETLPLSICYRCPRKVIDLAKEIVSHIEASQTAEDGVVGSSEPKDLEDGDWVLCRTNAPLVSLCMKLLSNGRRAAVKGREVGKQILAWIKKVSNEQDIPTFLELAQSYNYRETAKLLAAGKDTTAALMNDMYECCVALSAGCMSMLEVASRIESVFTDGASSGIMLCSIHKSKGLEAKRIHIIRKSVKVSVDWQRQQEKNLEYVAITRSLGELYWLAV